MGTVTKQSNALNESDGPSFDESLFVLDDNQSIVFYIPPGATKSKISTLIWKGGGRINNSWNKDVITLYDGSGDPKKITNKALEVYSVKYIYDSVEKNKRQPIENYKITLANGRTTTAEKPKSNPKARPTTTSTPITATSSHKTVAPSNIENRVSEIANPLISVHPQPPNSLTRAATTITTTTIVPLSRLSPTIATSRSVSPNAVQNANRPLNNISPLQHYSNTKLKYTPEDDEKIINYVSSHYVDTPPGSPGGIKLWKEMQDKKITEHSWQSMKDRYKKHLQDSTYRRYIEITVPKENTQEPLNLDVSIEAPVVVASPSPVAAPAIRPTATTPDDSQSKTKKRLFTEVESDDNATNTPENSKKRKSNKSKKTSITEEEKSKRDTEIQQLVLNLSSITGSNTVDIMKALVLKNGDVKSATQMLLGKKDL